MQCGGDSWTRAEFRQQVSGFVTVYREAGVGWGETVGLFMANGPTLLAALVAAAETGAVAALLAPGLAGDDLSRALRAGRVRHVFLDADRLSPLLALPEAVTFTLWCSGPPALLPPHVEPLDPALAAARSVASPRAAVEPLPTPFLLCGPGPTGRFRVHPVSTSELHRAAALVADVTGLSSSDVAGLAAPLAHGDLGLALFAAALRTGARFALSAADTAPETLRDVTGSGTTVLVVDRSGVASWAGRNDGGPPNSRVRVVLGCGFTAEQVAALQQRLGAVRTVQLYGSTPGEYPLWNPGGEPGALGRLSPFSRQPISVVRVAAEGELERNANHQLVPCRVGEEGELLVGVEPPTRPVAGIVQEAFRRGDAFRRTGDRVRRDAAGWFHLSEATPRA